MKQISILGCGWLGLPLAKSLIAKGFSVKGSTTTLAKVSVLENAKITPFVITLTQNGPEVSGKETMDLFLKNAKILIIDIPPKLRGDSSENFMAKIQNLIPFIENAGVQNVLFVSSTSVYSDDNATITTEESVPNPETESGKQLLAVEQLLKQNPNFQTTVVRFGGLIGEDRYPIRFLAGRQHLENPEAPVNLIHQYDCIGILEAIMDKNAWGETFNAVAPYHPSRKDYYTQKATELNLPLPEFDESNRSLGKTITSTKIGKILKYQFQKSEL